MYISALLCARVIDDKIIVVMKTKIKQSRRIENHLNIQLKPAIINFLHNDIANVM